MNTRAPTNLPFAVSDRSALAVAYIRVGRKGPDHATQRAAIERAADARGDVVDDWRSERRSQESTELPELERLLAEARAGTLARRRLYVFRLDLLTRTGLADTVSTLAALHAQGLEVVSVIDAFDLSGPDAERIASALAWAANLDRQIARERVVENRERLAAAGRPWGRPPRVDAPIKAKAIAMRSRGLSLRAIARRLKVSRSTVSRHLSASPKT